METLGLIAVIAGALAGAVYIGKTLWKFARWCIRVAKGVEVIHGLIQHELTPNGGGSLHDKITRTDNAAQATALALAEHLIVAQRDHDDLAAVMRQLGLVRQESATPAA